VDYYVILQDTLSNNIGKCDMTVFEYLVDRFLLVFKFKIRRLKLRRFASRDL
jgi:hypothetical protein